MTTQMQFEVRSTYVNVSADEEPVNESAGTALSSGTVKRHFQGGIVGDSVAAVLIARSRPDRLGYVATDRATLCSSTAGRSTEAPSSRRSGTSFQAVALTN